jgi:hypothetical protein
MSISVNDVLESARQLPLEDRQSLLIGLLDQDEAAWSKELGDPEVGHSDWFNGRVQKSLESSEPHFSTDEVMSRAREAVCRASRVKQSA